MRQDDFCYDAGVFIFAVHFSQEILGVFFEVLQQPGLASKIGVFAMLKSNVIELTLCPKRTGHEKNRSYSTVDSGSGYMNVTSSGLRYTPVKLRIMRTVLEKVASKQCRDIFGAWDGVKNTALAFLNPNSTLPSIKFPMMCEYRPDFSRDSPNVLQFIIT